LIISRIKVLRLDHGAAFQSRQTGQLFLHHAVHCLYFAHDACFFFHWHRDACFWFNFLFNRCLTGTISRLYLHQNFCTSAVA